MAETHENSQFLLLVDKTLDGAMLLSDREYPSGVLNVSCLLGRLCYFLGLLLCLFNTSLAIASTELAVERSYLIDDKFQFDINSIESASFIPFGKRLNLGFQSAPVWLRLHVAPAISTAAPDTSDLTEKLILRVGPHYTNRVDVYEFDQGQWRVRTVGDLFPVPEKFCADDFYCLQLHDASVQPKTIYLRVQTPNILVIDTEVTTLEKLSQVSVARARRIFISLTLASLLLVISIFWIIKYRSGTAVFFVGTQASILIYLFCIYGFTASWFPGAPPELLDALPQLMFISRSFFTILTIFFVVKTYCESIVYTTLIFSLLAGCCLNVLLFFIDYGNLSIKLNLIIFSIYPLIHMYGVITSRKMIRPLRILFFVGFPLYYVVLFPLLIDGIMFGGLEIPETLVLNISDWRLNGVMIGLFIFLITKFEEDDRQKKIAEKINQRRIETIEADSYAALLSDRNTMIDLLTHDLKNPLGTITFASSALKEQLHGNQSATQRLRHIDQCVNRMNHLIEHVALSAQVDRYVPPSSISNWPAAELIEELTETYRQQSRFRIAVDADAVFTADREMLNVIFGNLINNAYKYGHAAGAITISVTRVDNSTADDPSETSLSTPTREWLCFEISNVVGSFGVPDEAKIFERYYRHPNSMAVPGMGLGLSLVKAAATKIGASVDFHHAGDTATFTVRVPN